MPDVATSSPKDLAPDVLAFIDKTEAEIVMLKNQLSLLISQMRTAMNDEAARLADFQIGEDVEMRYGYHRHNRPDVMRRYRITRITGSMMRYEHKGEMIHPAQLWVNYYGKQVRADGTLGDKEHSLSSIHKPATV